MGRKAIWLLGLLLAIAALSLISPIAKAQEGTRVTMGPWRVLENADEITLYLTLPPNYAVDELETYEGGPMLFANTSIDSRQSEPGKPIPHLYASQPITIRVSFWPNENQLPMNELLLDHIQGWEEVEGFRREIEEEEDTQISGHDAYYVLIKTIHETDYGAISRRLMMLVRVNSYIEESPYVPWMPGGALYLSFDANYTLNVYPSSALPPLPDTIGGADASEVLKGDLHSILDSLQLSVGAAPAEEGVPIVWIIVPVICVVVAILALLYSRLR